jgi:hypothetical protein
LFIFSQDSYRELVIPISSEWVFVKFETHRNLVTAESKYVGGLLLLQFWITTNNCLISHQIFYCQRQKWKVLGNNGSYTEFNGLEENREIKKTLRLERLILDLYS